MPVSLSKILFRFWLGFLSAVGLGSVVYAEQIWDPLSPTFKVLTIGSTLAALLALWRGRAYAQAVVVAAGYALFCLGFTNLSGIIAALSGTVVAIGLVTIVIVYDRLVERLRFGKFLLVGPLVAGLFAAVTPMIEFRELIPLASGGAVLAYAELGLLLGVGVSLGTEISDWVLRSRETSGASVV